MSLEEIKESLKNIEETMDIIEDKIQDIPTEEEMDELLEEND